MKQCTLFCKSVFLLILLTFGSAVFAQIPTDLSGYKASAITDEQLRGYLQQATKAGLTEEQIEFEIRKRGLPESELVVLKGRIKNILSGSSSVEQLASNQNTVSRDRKDIPTSIIPTSAVNEVPIDERIFGSDLFTNSALNFEPDLRMATPSNYKLGPDDQLIIDVYGVNQSQQTQTVSPEGSIKLNYVGPVYVNGLTVEEAKSRIISKLSQIYPAIRTGNTKVQISLGAIRSIRVTLLGSVVKPGTYTLPSLATLFNALYSSGGPDKFGSFRTIELIRKNRVLEKIDIYRFLLKGDQSQNIRLEDMDVIRIPVAETKVQVVGEIKRPGIFELLPGENLHELINGYSGGFQKTAYTAIIKAERKTDRERRLIDIRKENMISFIPQDGDVFSIDRILDRYENAINILGAVFRPGRYSFQTGMKVSDLINKADGLREDAFSERALLYRLKSDKTKEIVALDLRNVLRGGSNDLPLIKDDSLVVNSLSELSNEYLVAIGGAVRKPGTYLYRAQMSLKDLILQAGGILDEASLTNIEVARRRPSVDPNDPSAQLSDLLPFNMDTIELSINQQDFPIMPHDIVSVKTNPFKKSQETVVIEGQVLYPGPYAILTRQERLSSIIKRAGNVLIEGNLKGASMRRKKRIRVESTDAVEKMSRQAKDSTGMLLRAVADDYDHIALDLEAALREPEGESDIYIQNGDIINIPVKDEMINVEGEVLHPVKMNYKQGLKLKHYINAAGGFVSSANKNKVFVVYANGKASRTKKLLFFRNYPEIEEGAQIFVPKYVPLEKPKKSAAEVMATVSALATMSYLLIYLINQFK